MSYSTRNGTKLSKAQLLAKTTSVQVPNSYRVNEDLFFAFDYEGVKGGSLYTRLLYTAGTVLNEQEWNALLDMAVGAPADPVEFTVAGTNFQPKLTLASGSDAVLEWIDNAGTVLATGPTPTLTFPNADPRVIRLRSDQLEDVEVLNLGYYYLQDGPGIPPESANYVTQPVTGIANLNSLIGLKWFMAAVTNGTDTTPGLYTGARIGGTLDFTGMEELLTIECCYADLTGVTLDGCSSLRRLCVEQNELHTLDLNPVRTTLVDLRAALMSLGVGGLTFTPMTQPFPEISHYCVRDQNVVNGLSISLAPKAAEWWIWQTGATVLDQPVSPLLEDVRAYSNSYDLASQERLLEWCNSQGLTGGHIELQGGGSEGIANDGNDADVARDALIGKGWTVTVNAPIVSNMPWSSDFSGTPAEDGGWTTSGGTISYNSGVLNGSWGGYGWAVPNEAVDDDGDVRIVLTAAAPISTQVGRYMMFGLRFGAPTFGDAAEGGIRVGWNSTGVAPNVADANGPNGGTAMTQVGTPALEYTTLRIDAKVSTNTIEVYYDGVLVYTYTNAAVSGFVEGNRFAFLGEAQYLANWTAVELSNI